MLDELAPILKNGKDHRHRFCEGVARIEFCTQDSCWRRIIFIPAYLILKPILINSILNMLRKTPARSASLDDVRNSDAVLVLGEDVPNVAPMLGLALRKSTLQKPMAIAEKLNIQRWHDAAVREALAEADRPAFYRNT